MNEVKNTLKKLLLAKFDKKNSDHLIKLLGSLSAKDELIAENETRYLNIYLSLPSDKVSSAIHTIEELSKTSHFAGAFFIEKIPCLIFYDIYDEITSFLMIIKDYGSRALAYYLGSDNLKNDDLEDILNESNLDYYISLLNAVKQNHRELRVLCAHILRYSRELASVLPEKNMLQYINICKNIYQSYGTDTAFLFVENANKLLSFFSIKEIEEKIKELNSISKEYLDFCIKNPQLILKTQKKCSHLSSKDIMLKILIKEDLNLVCKYPFVLKDKYFYALISNWNRYQAFHKENILDQLRCNNFRSKLISLKKIDSKLSSVNKDTNNNWFKDWYHTSKEVSNAQIYEEIKKMLIPNSYFEYKTRKIFALNRNLFETIKNKHESKDILKLIHYLQKICMNRKIQEKLIGLEAYLTDKKERMIKTYSENELMIKTWDRNPWVDYARSDELYSCTSIGKSADIYAPLYLADINMNNLDIWNNGIRIGRIHLILTKDEMNSPLLLVDSIEGSDRLMRNEKRLNYILQSILHYAKFLTIHKVIFNCDLSFNNTPKLFVRFLRLKNNKVELAYIKRYIYQSTLKELVPHPINTFLETIKNKEEGIVKGIIMSS